MYLSEYFHHLNIVIHLSPIRGFIYFKIQANIIKLINYIGNLGEVKFDILHFSSNILYVIHHNNAYAEYFPFELVWFSSLDFLLLHIKCSFRSPINVNAIAKQMFYETVNIMYHKCPF